LGKPEVSSPAIEHVIPSSCVLPLTYCESGMPTDEAL